MLFIAGNDTQYCPYRDCLGLDTSSGRVSWYQLLSVSTDVTQDELLHRWNQRRTLVAQKRAESGNPVWGNILDELDRSLACLSHPRKMAEYDDDLSRRSRQVSLIRPQQLNEQEASEFLQSTRSAASDQKSGDAQNAFTRTQFEPLRVIGKGQHGTKVFEAHDFTLGRTVAVKCLEKPARTESRCRSFLEEAKFLASITHAHLVEVHAVSEKKCWFVMEFLGQSVRDHFQQGRKGGASPEHVTKFLEQALTVLQCLHDRGVIHGAISTKSFLVTETGVIKLIDAPGCTRAGLFRSPAPDQICVAPELLSPESFGEPRATVDLYMLGYAAIELLAGDKLPKWFRKVSTDGKPDQKQWLRWHASPFEKVPALEQLVPGIPAELASVIEKLCQKQVVDRYRTAADALKDLIPVENIKMHRVKLSKTRPSEVSSSSSGVDHLGGDAPLTQDAKTDSEPAHDLLTILQDSELLWKTFRSNRNLQLAAGFVLSLMLLLMFLPSGAATEFAQTDAVKESPPQAFTKLDHGKGDGKDTRDEGKDDPKNDTGIVKYILPKDLEPIPVAVYRRPEQKTPAPRREDSLTLQTPVARRFAVDLKDSGQFVKWRTILAELKNARSSDQRTRLLEEARKISPDDPRALFIFAAAYEFGPRAKDQLREAVELSGDEYTQPFRKSIEAVLRSSMQKRRIGDQVFADLIRFRDQLHADGFSSTDAYDWEWIGRVIGYIERISPTDESLRTIMTSNKPKILNNLQSDAVSCIERGRRSVLENPVKDFKADVFFPTSPMVEIDFCLATLMPPLPGSQGRDAETAVAASRLAADN